jgi:Tol biopolymer transport system component
MTRGANPLAYLSVTRDGRTLAYFSFRLGRGDVFLRDLATGSERVLGEGPVGDKSYPAISPDGIQLAYGTVVPGGARPERPIFIASLTDRTWRTLGDDCGGRPREWVDEQRLVIERFARLNSIALIDTRTGAQSELLQSAAHSVRNPRLSPDRRWVAFDASAPGEPASVCLAPFQAQPISESDWVTVERSASHPFWSADGRSLYYLPTGMNPLVRSTVRGRRVSSDGLVAGAPVAVFASNDLMIPSYLPGTAPIVIHDRMILVLGDFRGDIWLMELDSPAKKLASKGG